jgi:hypothetical protein
LFHAVRGLTSSLHPSSSRWLAASHAVGSSSIKLA